MKKIASAVSWSSRRQKVGWRNHRQSWPVPRCPRVGLLLPKRGLKISPNNCADSRLWKNLATGAWASPILCYWGAFWAIWQVKPRRQRKNSDSRTITHPPRFQGRIPSPQRIHQQKESRQTTQRIHKKQNKTVISLVWNKQQFVALWFSEKILFSTICC